jgi:Spy/CpxP family protein refolding chaperone
MARQIAWILAAALVSGAPASAASLCGHDTAQTDQRGGKAGDQDKDHRDSRGKNDHRPWKFWQGDSKATLGITNQQSTELEQIFQSTMPQLEATKDRIDKLEATLSQTIKDNTADLATVSQQIDRLESARAELYKSRTLMLYRMRGRLSADQRAKLQAMWEAGRPKNPDQTGRR